MPASTLPAASPTPADGENPLPPSTSSRPTDLNAVRARSGKGGTSSTGRLLGAGGVAAAGAAGAAIIVRRRRSRADAEARWYSSELLSLPDDGPAGAPDPPAPAETDGAVATKRPYLYRPE